MEKKRIKSQTFTHIPVYSGDVSGAASALYGFGGLIVICDPSGCNSTFNTFDELRWEKEESAIFISALRESEAISGDEGRLISDIEAAVSALERRPSFIALLSSPVPDIIGTDFYAISRLLEKDTGLPTFYVPTNAMHDYTVGGANALLALAQKLLPKPPAALDKAVGDHPLSVSLLGLTPFEYPHEDQVDRIYHILEGAGLRVCANWGESSKAHPMGFSDIGQAACADVSLVLSSLGIKAASYLYERYLIPYVVGDPLASGEWANLLLESLRSAAVTGESSNPCLDILKAAPSASSGPLTAFVGEPVTMGSAAAAHSLSAPDEAVRLICTTELSGPLTNSSIPHPRGEAAIADELKKAAVIYGDQLFKNAFSHGVRAYDQARQVWIERPHLAMSGRMYLRD